MAEPLLAREHTSSTSPEPGRPLDGNSRSDSGHETPAGEGPRGFGCCTPRRETDPKGRVPEQPPRWAHPAQPGPRRHFGAGWKRGHPPPRGSASHLRLGRGRGSPAPRLASATSPAPQTQKDPWTEPAATILLPTSHLACFQTVPPSHGAGQSGPDSPPGRKRLSQRQVWELSPVPSSPAPRVPARPPPPPPSPAHKRESRPRHAPLPSLPLPFSIAISKAPRDARLPGNALFPPPRTISETWARLALRRPPHPTKGLLPVGASLLNREHPEGCRRARHSPSSPTRGTRPPGTLPRAPAMAA